jgi:hypothetical protein
VCGVGEPIAVAIRWAAFAGSTGGLDVLLIDQDTLPSQSLRAYHPAMPDIDFAFLADAAETVPGQKFHVLGGGIARIGGRRFPLRHPHLALVIGLQVTAPETEREHEIRFVLLDPDGAEVAGATGSLVARSQRDGRDATLTFSIDLWNLTFPTPGDYSFRLLVNGSERKRLPLLLLRPPAGGDGEGVMTGTRPSDD